MTDYGTPGSPNPDPHYRSPREIAEAEVERAQRIADFRADVSGFVADTRGDMDAADVLAVLEEIVAAVRAEVRQ